MDEHEEQARRMVCYAEARDGDSELVQAIAGALRERAEKIQSLEDAWTGCNRERNAAKEQVRVLREALIRVTDALEEWAGNEGRMDEYGPYVERARAALSPAP